MTGMREDDGIRVEPIFDERTEREARRRYNGRVMDSEYYFNWIVFLVEDCYFNVPRVYFEQSEDFLDMYRQRLRSRVADGTSLDCPFRLENVSAADFKALLKLLIPLPGREGENLTKVEWLGVLKLSNKWGFGEIRDMAISKLTREKMDAVERILIGREYSIATWLVYAHAYLVIRKEFLSVEEGERLGGMSFTLKYGQARQKAEKKFWPDVENCQSIVIEVFELPWVKKIPENSVVIEET